MPESTKIEQKTDDKFIEYLKHEKTKNNAFLDADHYDLVKKMLPYIGDPNPDIRDHTIYECLAYVSKELKSQEKKELITQYIGEGFLFFDINNVLPYSALRRTFTLLQLATLLHEHNQSHYIDNGLMKEIANALFRYVREETVIKGYDTEVGWIHSIAHSADVLGQLLVSEEVEQSMHEKLLDAFIEKIQVNHYIYVDEEDERIARAMVKGLLSGQLPINLVDTFCQKLANYDKQIDYKHFSMIHINVKSVLRSLYFALEAKEYNDLQLVIIDALNTAKKDKIL